MIGQRAELVASRQPGADERAAYERVLGDAIEGDATLFARMDYVEEAWRIVDSLRTMNAPVREYEPGSWGPAPRAEDIVPPGGWADPTMPEARSMTDPDRTAEPGAELARLEHAREWNSPWRKWGPYLSERQWGTVREDYSQDGDAWSYFPHDHARSRAYHWGEDGLAGFSDLKQRLCFALALWNGNDPILKERLFGLTNGQGNHGEDVKEYYFYLDSTPTHSYMKWLYKYPHAAFPYADLIEKNAAPLADRLRVRADRHRCVPRGPLLRRRRRIRQVISGGLLRSDHGDEPRAGGRVDSPVADVVVPQHVVVVARQGQAVTWRRRTDRRARASSRRRIPSSAIDGSTAMVRRRCSSPRTRPTASGSSAFPTSAPYVKDAFHSCVVHGNADAVNPAETGTKAAAHYTLDVGRRAVGQRSPVA